MKIDTSALASNLPRVIKILKEELQYHYEHCKVHPDFGTNQLIYKNTAITLCRALKPLLEVEVDSEENKLTFEELNIIMDELGMNRGGIMGIKDKLTVEEAIVIHTKACQQVEDGQSYSYRYGQAVYNLLPKHLTEEIHMTKLDTFYKDQIESMRVLFKELTEKED